MTTTFNYGGTELTSFGRVTLMDDYLDMPEKRGGNITIPYRHGTSFATKYYNERVITLGLAIIDTSATDLETSMDTLRSLLSLPRTLTMTLSSGEIRTIIASVDKPIQFQRFSTLIGKVVIEFVCARPYWRGNALIADNTTTIDASPKTLSVNNTGTVDERDPKITMVGPLEDVTLSNPESGAVMTYTGVISTGDIVVIQTNSWGEYEAAYNGTTNVIGNITHSGSAALMTFVQGVNEVIITSTTPTTGTISVEFYPPFL
jgi:predicted phage tail component-like protein